MDFLQKNFFTDFCLLFWSFRELLERGFVLEYTTLIICGF